MGDLTDPHKICVPIHHDLGTCMTFECKGDYVSWIIKKYKGTLIFLLGVHQVIHSDTTSLKQLCNGRQAISQARKPLMQSQAKFKNLEEQLAM